MRKAIVTGAGGFIGSHLVEFLKKKKYFVVGIDIKKPQFSKSYADKFILADLRDEKKARKVISKSDELYMLAADMGGVEYITTTRAKIVHNNSLINLNSLESAHKNKISKVFFSSSACVYPYFKQTSRKSTSLKERDAIPAEPDTVYGWEKLFTEQACLAYEKDYDLQIRIARFHNIYGPQGIYKGGREKSPAAICRKIAQAKNGDSIEVWGDGKQLRSYCYIDDCLEGLYKLMQSDYSKPLNIGSDRLISIDGLVDTVAKVSGKKIIKNYDLSKPQGVRSRNSDNTLTKKILSWEPSVSLEKGLTKTYQWIEKQVLNKKRGISTK